MRKLFLSGFVGLSLVLAVLGTAEACVANGRVSSPPHSQGVKQPKIVFRSDGRDVVASIQVTANASPHALWTSYEVGADYVVALRYCLIQNPDRFVRSTKTVTIEWHLKNFAVLPSPPLTFRVEDCSITPNSQELKALVSQLQLLIADKADRAASVFDKPVQAVIINTKKSDVKNTIGGLLVRVVKGSAVLSEERVRVGINGTTKLEKLVGGKRLPIKFDDLKEGCTIQLSGIRAVGESYPVLVSPASIIVLETVNR